MKIDMKIVYNNADNGERDAQAVSVASEDDRLEYLGAICTARETEQTFEQLFKEMYDNTSMDGGKKGVLHDELYEIFSRRAFEKNGWHDVTIDVIGISIDGEETRLEKFIYSGTVENSVWSIQMTRDGYMYCYS